MSPRSSGPGRQRRRARDHVDRRGGPHAHAARSSGTGAPPDHRVQTVALRHVRAPHASRRGFTSRNDRSWRAQGSKGPRAGHRACHEQGALAYSLVHCTTVSNGSCTIAKTIPHHPRLHTRLRTTTRAASPTTTVLAREKWAGPRARSPRATATGSATAAASTSEQPLRIVLQPRLRSDNCRHAYEQARRGNPCEALPVRSVFTPLPGPPTPSAGENKDLERSAILMSEQPFSAGARAMLLRRHVR